MARRQVRVARESMARHGKAVGMTGHGKAVKGWVRQGKAASKARTRQESNAGQVRKRGLGKAGQGAREGHSKVAG
jgi:hypothetical protein